MTAELGGPLPREGIEAKVARDVGDGAADIAWIKMIIPDESAPAVVAGSAVLWSHEDGEPISEIGWMVLPEFQGTRDRHDSGPRPASAGPRRRPLGTGARVPGHHQRPLQRHLPLGWLPVRRRAGCAVRWPGHPGQPLGHQPWRRPDLNAANGQCHPARGK